MARLGQAEAETGVLSDLSGDWTALGMLREEFASLRDVCRKFARFQLGFRAGRRQ